jgi:predicted enzyme related to lactoylglutathione lyase
VAGHIVHWEIMGPDGDALNEFYCRMFGWKSEAVPGFDSYHMVGADQAGMGGAVGKGGDDMLTYMTFYIEVDSIDEQLRKITSAGGITIMPRTVVPGTVVFAMFQDPAGNVVGLVEPGEPPAE